MTHGQKVLVWMCVFAAGLCGLFGVATLVRSCR